jgi:trimethylamine--corrinoid protein Co-methyltransferase
MDAGDAERIHEASLALLDEPGVRIEHDRVRELMLAGGARPGAGPADVRLPREMVADCLALCPREVTLADRRGGGAVLTAACEPAFWSCPGLYLWQGGRHRPFTSSDMAAVARLLDRLENVHGVFGFSLDDVPPAGRDVAGLSIIARNTAKHVRVLCFTSAGADVLVEMKHVVGARPWFSVGFTAHGPLRWTELALDIFRRTAGHGIPVSINGEPMAGVSGPVTLAGAAAVGNAEILAGLVVNQLLEPGRPCIYNLGLAHVMDMRTALAVTGGPENALLADASAAMGRFYGLPSCSWVSTEAMCADAQAGLEKMFGFHAHMASGVSLIWGVGQLESEMTFSPAQAVIDDEMISYVRRYLRGVDIGQEALALGVSRSVGIAGSFLDHEHTLRHFRSELFMPTVLWRDRRARWRSQGARTLEQRADEAASTLMQALVANGLDEDQTRELDRIAERFLRSLGGKRAD